MKQKVKEQFHLFLTPKGLKGTLQRNLILDAFLNLDRPTHIDELYLFLRSKHPSIGHATVYRALRLFSDAGIAREFTLGDGLTRYELAGQGKRHDYLVCSDCGTVTAFENSRTEQHQVEVAAAWASHCSHSGSNCAGPAAVVCLRRADTLTCHHIAFRGVIQRRVPCAFSQRGG